MSAATMTGQVEGTGGTNPPSSSPVRTDTFGHLVPISAAGKNYALADISSIDWTTIVAGTAAALPIHGIFVGTAGVVKFDSEGGQTVVSPSLPVGWHPIRATKIYSAGSTATGLMANW